MKKFIILALLIVAHYIVQAQSLKIMSYNIHHGTDAKEKDNLTALGEFIKSSGAELVGLQEVDSICNRSGKVDQMKRLGELTGMHYAFVRHYAYDGGAYGLGILSKYPISDVKNSRITLLKTTPIKNSLALLSAFIQLPGKMRLLFSTGHFALDAPTRDLQASETIAYLKSNRYPVIFTGDLNAEQETKEIQTLKSYFSDVDSANLPTFSAVMPTKRIDYILVNKKFMKQVLSYKVFNGNEISDHLPILSSIELKVK